LHIATPPCPILQGLFEIPQRRVLLNSPLPQHLGTNYFGVVLPSCRTCCCSPLGFFHYSLPLSSPCRMSLLLLMLTLLRFIRIAVQTILPCPPSANRWG